MEIQWFGHPTFKLQTDEGVITYLDPFFEANPVSPVKLSEIREADLVAVTHGHDDHIGDALGIIEQTGAHLIGTPEICHYAETHGVTYNEESTAMNIGGSVTREGVTFHGTISFHASALYGEEWEKDQQMIPNGSAMGYLIEIPEGPRIYYSGDTGLTKEMQLIGDIYRPDIAIIPIGGRYTMTPKLAARAASFLGAEKVIPMHYNTFDFNRQSVGEYQKLVDDLTSGVEVIDLEPGDVYEPPGF